MATPATAKAHGWAACANGSTEPVTNTVGNASRSGAPGLIGAVTSTAIGGGDARRYWPLEGSNHANGDGVTWSWPWCLGSRVHWKRRRPAVAAPASGRLSSIVLPNTSKSGGASGGVWSSGRLPTPRTSRRTVTGTSWDVWSRSAVHTAENSPTAPANSGGAPGGSGRTCTRSGVLSICMLRFIARPTSHWYGSASCAANTSEALAAPMVASPAASG